MPPLALLVPVALPIAGAPAKGGAVQLAEEWDPDWQRALSLLGDVVVTEQLPPGKALGLAGGTIVFPALAEADPAVTQKRLAVLEKDLERIQAKLANEEFLAKAPPEEVDKQRGREEDLGAEIDRLRSLT